MKLSLADMPEVVLAKIIGNLDVKSIQVLRKVNHNLRDFIDDIKPDSQLQTATIWITESGDIMVSYGLEYEGDIHVYYKKHEEGCLIMTKNGEKVLEKENFVERAVQDFELVLKNQKSTLDVLCLNRSHSGVNFDRIVGIFSCESKKLKVRKLILESIEQSHIIQVLSFLDCKSLEELQLDDMANSFKTFKMEKLARLDHWKNIKVFSMKNCILSENDLEHFTHFSKASVYLNTVTTEGLIFLKETFIHKNPSFLEFHLHYKDFNDFNDFLETMGTPYIDPNFGRDNKSWYFKIPGSEYLMEILLLDDHNSKAVLSRYPLHWYSGKRFIQ